MNLSRFAKRLAEKNFVEARSAKTVNYSRVTRRLVEKKIVDARSAETELVENREPTCREKIWPIEIEQMRSKKPKKEYDSEKQIEFRRVFMFIPKPSVQHLRLRVAAKEILFNHRNHVEVFVHNDQKTARKNQLLLRSFQ